MVKFSPNGKFVLACTLDSALRLWNVSSDGKCSKTYRGHVNSKFCCFADYNVSNPNRQSIVSGSEDGNIYLYGMQDKEKKQVLAGGHTDAALAVSCSKTKEFIASGGMQNDRTVKFWAPPSAFR